jgi:hypothetical protein
MVDLVAPLSALKDNLEHLHQKIDSLENTLDERLPSGTHILNAGQINDRTSLANAGAPDDADHTSWATPDFSPYDDAATFTTAARLASTISLPCFSLWHSLLLESWISRCSYSH